MNISKIKLTNFRNYSDLEFKFTKPITVFLGLNAQGKTNFLESVYFLATSKSFKAEMEEEQIKDSEEFLRVEGEIQNSEFGIDNTDEQVNLEIALQNNSEGVKKKIRVNGIPRRLVDYAGNLVVVEFLPEDINLVAGSPSLRRNHVDVTLSQIDKGYKKALSSYGQVLTNKNRLLKNIREGSSSVNELTFWIDKQLELGKVIVEKRQELFEFLNSTEKKFGEFDYEYVENVLSKERLEEYRSREIDSASSLIGPHRDDFVFKLNGKELSKYGSRGEQRTSVLDLKISEVEFIELKIGSRPVLLLDDIFSELDLSHQKHVLDLSKMQQTIITGVEFNPDLADELKNSAIFFVENGQITEQVDK